MRREVILDKAKMAHEWVMKYGKVDSNYNRENTVQLAWQYADAMQAEADKRNNKETCDKNIGLDSSALKPSNSMELEWQPDWSQAPEWAEYFAMDDDGEFYYFKESPSMAVCSWQPQSHGELSETFDHGYKGNWQESLRKRP